MSMLANQRCLIVGGTSGIGLEAAREFINQGARVVIAGLDAADAIADRIGAVAGIRADATSPAEVQELYSSAIRALSGLDVLYHVAGGSGRRFGDGALHECTDAGWQSTIDLNLTSTFHTNRAAVRHYLDEKKPGVILNMATALALSPSPLHFDACAYTAAKGGVIALSMQIAARYASQGIRVNVLAPGLIDTPMAQRAVTDGIIQRYVRAKQPLVGGPGLPQDVAGAAAFLCSNAARMITGAVLPVDGGWHVSDAGQDAAPAT